MTTRNERLSELLRIISESFLTGEPVVTLETAEAELPAMMKQINSLLDDEFVAGYDYRADPTAQLLPGRPNQKKKYYGAQVNRRGPGRPRKNPIVPSQPTGKHLTTADPESEETSPEH